jgi:hypothetical protein
VSAARVAIALLNALFAICAAAAEPADPQPYTEDASRAGTPWRIVTPKYPTWAAKDQLTGAVDVEGVIDGSGALSAIEYKPDTPAAAAFVPGLKPMVTHWRFNVPTGPDCMPQPEKVKVTVRVEFFMQDGAPHVFASLVTRQETRGQGKREGYNYKVTQRAQPQYPYRPLWARIEAVVHARIDVAAAGEVTRVHAEAYPVVPTDAAIRNDFEEESRKALMGWRYGPNPADWRACYTIVFSIKN